MKVCFKDESFAFEFVRNLGFMYYGGADLGEMIATAGEITEGDFESWYAGWHKRAQRTLSRADADFNAGHLVSARESYLRASTYFRTAEFYLHGEPDDPRILSESRASQRHTPRRRSSLDRHGSRSKFLTRELRCRGISTRLTIPESHAQH